MAKVESQDGKIIGKSCPVFDYTEKKIVKIGALQKRNRERIGKNKEAYVVFVTMGRKIKTDKIWLCESVGKLKGIGKQGEV